MKQSRGLSLKREALAELSTADLSVIAAGAADPVTQWAACDAGNSYFACSVRCQWTFNTCDC